MALSLPSVATSRSVTAHVRIVVAKVRQPRRAAGLHSSCHTPVLSSQSGLGRHVAPARRLQMCTVTFRHLHLPRRFSKVVRFLLIVLWEVASSAIPGLGGKLKMVREDSGGTLSDPEEMDENFEGDVFRHRVLQNGEVQIHYVETGPVDGQLVLMLHGFPSFWYTWKCQLGPLGRAGFHVVAPDLRGYNLSSKPRKVADYGRRQVLSDVQKLIEHCGGGRPAYLVGHDWGGNIAWAFAHDFPHHVAKLAVLNMPHPSLFWKAITSRPSQMRRSWYIFLFQAPKLGEAFLMADSWRVLKQIVGQDLARPQAPPHVDRHIEAFSQPGALTAAINYYRSLFNHWSRPPHSIHKLEMPVAVIWGEKEFAFDPDLAVPPADIVPHCHVLKLPNATHWVMWDEPEVVNRRLLEFFAESAPAGDHHPARL